MTKQPVAIPSLYKPMTKAQLARVVGDYAAEFPGWSRFNYAACVRVSGPIQQMVWFQAMSSGSYRPTHVINALPIRIPRMLTQNTFRPTTVEYEGHERNWRAMLIAMDSQFKPSIRKPLDIAEVLELCEAEARETTNDLAMLAILYAWLERDDDAWRCCERMQSSPLPTLAPMPQWEQEMKSFGHSLAREIEVGGGRKFLERLTAERSEPIGKKGTQRTAASG